VTEERSKILRMIQEGQITPDEGVALLESLSGKKEVALGAAQETPPATDELSEERTPPEKIDFGPLWLIPLAAGGVMSAVGLALIVIAGPKSLFLVCGLMPLLLGLAVIGLAFWSRTARWLHIRIRGEQRINISFPLPLRLAGWILRLLRPFVPQLKETGLDEVILSLDEGLAGEGGFYVDVQDDEDGERVQVYIG